MIPRFLMLAVCVFGCSVSSAQRIKLESSPVTIFVGAESVENVDGSVVLTGEIEGKTATRISALTDEEIDYWEVETQDWGLVDFTESDDGRSIIISDPGRVKIACRGMNRGRGRIIVEIKAGPLRGGVDVPEPTDHLKKLVEPIATKLRSDLDKAAVISIRFPGFAQAIRGNGVGPKINTAGVFGKISDAALKDLNMSAGASIGAEIEDILTSYVGIDRTKEGHENKVLSANDRLKIAEVFDAIAWAGGQ